MNDVSDASDSDSESDGGAEDKKDTQGHETKSLEITIKENETLVVPSITNAKVSLNDKELALRSEVTEHISSVMVLHHKYFTILYNIAKPMEQGNSEMGLSDDPPSGGAGGKHFDAANMPATILSDMVSKYNNGRTDEQVKLEVTLEQNVATDLGWQNSLAVPPSRVQPRPGSFAHPGTPLDGHAKIVMPMAISNNSADGGSPNQILGAKAGQNALDKMTKGEKLIDGTTSRGFQHKILKTPSIHKM